MIWRCRLLCLPILMLAAACMGCQTTSQGQLSCAQESLSCAQEPLPCSLEQLPCGEGCASGCTPEPLIIFIGADRDLVRMGQLKRVTRDFRNRGYNAVYFDPWKQFDDPGVLADMIRNAVRCRGQRVMLVGWSYGAVVGLQALQIVEKEGICVDTFVELDCFNLQFYMGDNFHPPNAGRVIVIRSQLNQPAAGYCQPEAYELDSFWHLGVPTNDHTRCKLTTEANRLRTYCCPNDLTQSQPVPVDSGSSSELTESAAPTPPQ